MDITELKDEIAQTRESLKTREGKTVVFSPHGPIGVGLIEAVVEILAAQQAQIDELKGKLSTETKASTPAPDVPPPLPEESKQADAAPRG